MKYLLALLAASTYADDTITVTLESSDDNVKQGDSVDFICSWELDAEYTDYDEDNFQMYWKLAFVGEDNEDEIQTIAHYNPQPGDDDEADDTTFYLNNVVEGRVTLTPNFDARDVNLTISGLTIADDDMRISCEVHWGRRFEDAKEKINVYVDADEVDLEEIESYLEGRTSEDNGTVTEPEDTTVATCTVRSIYPLPEFVTFLVGDEEMEVDIEDDDTMENDDGTFTISADLTLAPMGQYHGDEVSCISIAAEGADVQEPGENDTFTLEVTYYTDNVELVIGQANLMGDDQYNVVENNQYTVSCTANGNPAPVIKITNSDGEELSADGVEIVATRAPSDAIQHITCSAENNDEDGDFDQGVAVEDEAQLEVYYIGNVDLGDDKMEGEYGKNFEKACNVEGNPPPKVQWTKGGDNDIIDEGNLDLGSLTYGEAGEYTCTASNAAGSDSDSFELAVNGPCIVKINKKQAGSAQQEPGMASLNLECEVVGTDCEVTWDSSLENFIALGETTNEGNLYKLSFDAFDMLAEPAEFYCKAKNEKGEKSDSVTIGEDETPACCQAAGTASLGTGAIVGIVIAIPAILIIIGAAVFFCRKRTDGKDECVDEGDDAEPEKQPLQADHDGEGGNAGDDAV